MNIIDDYKQALEATNTYLKLLFETKTPVGEGVEFGEEVVEAEFDFLEYYNKIIKPSLEIQYPRDWLTLKEVLTEPHNVVSRLNNIKKAIETKIKDLEAGRAETKFNIILTKDEVDDLQIYEESREAEVKAQIREIAEGRRVRTEAQAGQADTETWEKKETIALKLVIDGSMAYWDNTLLPTIKGKRFDILLKLAGKPKDIVVHQDLSELIESDSEKNREAILRQYISGLRKAFPTPYNDRSHPQCIIKTKRMEGYYLNLSPDLVEIV